MSTLTTIPTSPASQQESWLARGLHNLGRFPARTWRTLVRLFDSSYQLERRADNDVRRWLDRARREQLETVPGMSSPRECRLLAYLASIAPEGGDIVEIGAWMGRSTAWLVEGADRRPRQTQIVSIDPHERNTWEAFQETVRRFELTRRGLKVHRARSHDVGRTWTRPISMLWVDGCHEYDAVIQDIADFTPYVVPSGWVVFDDAAGGVFPGVEQAIAERMMDNPDFQHVATLRHLAIFRRKS